jgi:hypothetical protein
MGITYADIYDPEVLEKLIGADYQNEARLVQSGILSRAGLPTEGSQIQWIKQTLFSTDDEGQTIGVGSEINLKNKVQEDYAAPLFWRADGAELDDVSEEIMAKLQSEGAEADMANAISAKSAQMIDTAGIKIIDGCAQFIISESTNYNNASGSQVNLVDLEQTKSTRGEKGVDFEAGFMVMRGLMYHKLASLGLVAATSNTMGNMKQDEIVRGGLKGTILDMNIFVTDKIALESGESDHYIHFLEAGALKMKLGGGVNIDPVLRSQRSFTDSIKFRVKACGIVEGLSWGSAKTNPANVTNTALATGTNYEQAASYIKNVPMCVARFDAPTF